MHLARTVPRAAAGVTIPEGYVVHFMKFLSSAIGRKFLMALTGVAWYLFVLSHMLANLAILVSAEGYNRYSHALTSNPLIYVAEAGLVLTFALHAYEGFALTARKRRAKPVQNAVAAKGIKGASLESRSMIFTGSLTLVFVILHLVNFKYGPHYTVDYGDGPIRDLHRLVLEVFREPGAVIWYLICLVFLGLHLYHGVSSSFQTFGFNHPKYNGAIKAFGWIYAFVVAAGFIAQPVYVYAIHRTGGF